MKRSLIGGAINLYVITQIRRDGALKKAVKTVIRMVIMNAMWAKMKKLLGCPMVMFRSDQTTGFD